MQTFVPVTNEKEGEIFVGATVDDDYENVKLALMIAEAEAEGDDEREVEAEAEVEAERDSNFWHE